MTILPSSFLNPFALHDKWLSRPRVVLAHREEECGGLYFCPWPCGIEVFDGKEFSRAESAIIFVNLKYIEDDDLPCVLAHEWRHHWQFHRGIKYDGDFDTSIHPGETWDDSQRRFFRSSACEMDALRFSARHAEGEWQQHDMGLVGLYEPTFVLSQGER